jgi:hypothetical protein
MRPRAGRSSDAEAAALRTISRMTITAGPFPRAAASAGSDAFVSCTIATSCRVAFSNSSIGVDGTRPCATSARPPPRRPRRF